MAQIDDSAGEKNSEKNSEKNRKLVAAAFDSWRKGTGNVFDLLAPEARWTITGTSPLSKTYQGRQQFINEVITPFNRRLSSPLKPEVRGIFADGDTVVVQWDGSAIARDGRPYRNTYAWFFEVKAGRVIRATAFFDTAEFDDLWTRVPEKP